MVERTEHFTLLLVDDNPTNLSLLAQIVEMDLPQIQVLPARSAEEGLELAVEHEVDGAFVDVQMPGMGGLELCRRFKENPQTNQIPVVLMTAHIATAELRAEGLDAGAYDFISQPISNVEMLARIKVMLRLRQSEKKLLKTNEQLRRQVETKTSTLRWLSGLLLAGGDDVAEEDRELANKLEVRLSQDSQFSIEHFSGQLFQEMPLRWQRTVLKLTLLEEIPLSLAKRLAEIEDIEGALDYLWRHNFFVDRFGDEENGYHFQQELREGLRRQAAVVLSAQEWEEVRLVAAEWHRQNGQPLVALKYLLAAELYTEAELLLSQQGPMLITGEQLPGLTEIMKIFPEKVAVKRGWMALFSGICMYQYQPKDADNWLELARTLFVSKGDGRGELLTLIQQVLQYLIIDGRLDLGRELLPRLEELLELHVEDLDLQSRSKGYAALAMGKTFFGSNLEQAESFAREGMKYAIKADSAESQFDLRLMCSYLALLKGRFSLMFTELEAGYGLIRRFSPTQQTLVSQKIFVCLLLSRIGDYFNFREQGLQLERSLGKAFLQQSSMGHVQCQYQIECMLSEGMTEEARDLVDSYVAVSSVVSKSHLRSLLLQYRALLWIGDPKRGFEAQDDLQQSTLLREEMGGFLHTLNNRIITAICSTEVGDFSRAEQLLQQALDMSTSQDEMMYRSSIYARQADLFLQQNRVADALQPLQKTLQLLEQQRQETFFLLTPDLLRRLLPAAVQNQILPEVARKLAIRHLRCEIREDGTFLPLLELITLGGSEIRLGGKKILDCSELGSVARHMVASLITAPNQKLGLELLLGLLWPESSTTKARGSFDTNLSRLRKALDTALGSGDSRNYLLLEKGVLTLQNTHIDSQFFQAAIMRAQQHVRRQELFQAGLAFRLADHLWQGEFLAGLDLPDELVAERQKITELRLEMVENWSKLLLDEAAEGAESLLLGGIDLDPTREQLVQLLYQSYLQNNDLVNSRKVLDHYRQALLSDDYSAAEAEKIVQALERDEPFVE